MSIRAMIAVVGILLAGCGDDGDGNIDTEEECREAGGRVLANPGGPAECEANEENVGHIPFGIEGATCCRPK